ncbi:MAG: SUMF1/EgtB/PvdO family nonheme iron enzyme [Candidatus Krumholzibacteriia bacterium]
MQTNPSLPFPTRVLLALAVVLLLVAGCGKQDLYEPPGSPYEIVGHLALPSANEGLAVLGRTVYVAGGEAGLHTIDWTDPTHPVLLATINTTKYAEDIQVVRTFDGGVMRDIAHVVEGTEGVTSYDVTDPSNPFDYNTGTTAVVGRTIFIDEDLDPTLPYGVYLAEDWKGVRIFESVIGDPGILAYNGVFVGTQGSAYGLVVRDGWGYCADNEMGLCVLDLRILDLDAVTLTSWADTPGSARFVALQDDYAFVADGVEGLAVFRIHDGDTPVKITQYDLSGFSESIALRDGLMALAGNLGGVHFFDVTNPEQPVYLGTTPTPNATDVVFSEDGYCLVMDEEAGLYVLAGHGPFSDIAAPAPVTDLVAEPAGATAIELTWTMTGDDRLRGLAAAVEIRYADEAIPDEAAWDAATPAANPPDPAEPGTRVTATVDGLTAGTTYHLAVRMVDDAGQRGPLAGDASATTAEGIILRNGTVDIEGGTVADTYTYTVEALWDGAFTVTEVVIDGAAATMTSDDGIVYTYQTTLPAGAHDYAFHFEADGVAPATTPSVAGPLVGQAAFLMGSPAGEPGRLADEVQHTVVFSRAIVAAAHEVTQGEWDAVMPPSEDQSEFPGDDRPMDSATWFQAVAYCNARSVADALQPAYTIVGQSVTWDPEASGWRLPTEAEWEYLCRGGTRDSALQRQHLEPELPGRPQPGRHRLVLRQRPGGPAVVKANPLGLCTTSAAAMRMVLGLVRRPGHRRRCSTRQTPAGVERVCRGGTWYYSAQECRSAARNAYPPDSADSAVGFRVVRNAPEPAPRGGRRQDGARPTPHRAKPRMPCPVRRPRPRIPPP